MSSGNGHPADDEQAREHPPVHDHQWVQQYNEWNEPTYKVCATCGATMSG